MYIHSKILKGLFVGVVTFLTFGEITAQIAPIRSYNTNIVVTPPYTSDISSYAEHTKIIISSTISTRIRLKVAIKGDNGLVLQTPAGINPGFISVEANVPYTLTAMDLDSYFSISNLSKNWEVLPNNALPVGNYRVCVTLLNSDGGVILNERCSNTFSILAIQPPQILQPICGSDQYKQGIQNIIFSWTPAPGAPVWTRYLLRIVEITNPDLSPAEALQSATTPPFFEQEVNGNTYLYGPNNPPLEKGNRYVFEVVALDDETHTQFANQGRSELCYFIYGKPEPLMFEVADNLSVNTSKNKVKADQTKQFPGLAFSPANINGTLYYQYPGPAVTTESSKTVNLGNANASALTPKQSIAKVNTVKMVDINGQKVNLRSTETNINPISDFNFLQTDFRDKNKSYPLPYMPYKLVVKYKIYDKATKTHVLLSAYDVQTSNIPKKYLKIQPDMVVGSGVTDKEGHFDQNIFLSDSMGLLAQNISVKIGGGEFYRTYTGALYRVFRLMVSSDHYCSPAHDILVQPFESKSFDDLYALIRGYGLTVNTKPYATENTYVSGNMEGVDVYILRKTRPYDLPDNEGQPKPKPNAKLPNIPGYEVIAQTKTNKNGQANFFRLIKNLGGYDKYFIYANTETSEVFDYESMVKEYKNFRKDEDFTGIEIGDNAVFNNEYVYATDYKTKLILFPNAPSVSGYVKQKGTGKALENAEVSLYNLGVIIPIKVNATTTDAQGKFAFKNISQTFYTSYEKKITIPYAVKAHFNGYKDSTSLVNNGAQLLGGQKITVGPLLLRPKAIIGGKIIDVSSLSGVMCKVTLIGGSWVNSDPPVPTMSGNTSQDNNKQTDLNHIQNLAGNLLQFGTGQTNNTALNMNVFQVTPINISGSNNKSYKDQKKIEGLSSQPLNVTFKMGASYFVLPAPSGKQKIIVDPNDNSKYFTDTLEVDLKDGLNQMTIQVTPKIHRIKLYVSEIKPGVAVIGTAYKQSVKKIYKAKVRVVGRTDYAYTNEEGFIELEFGGSDNFEIEVLPPDESDYEGATKTFSGIPATRNYLEYKIGLLKASRISGTVKARGLPVEGARVKLDLPGKNIETTTGTDGRYTLKGVPLAKNLVVQATMDNYVGDTAVVTVTSEYKDSVNLKLVKFGSMNYSKMLGFPIQVSNETEENGKTYITGELINLPRNGQIETQNSSQTLKFTKLEVTPGSVKGPDDLPYPVPVGGIIRSDSNSVSVSFNSAFKGRIEDKTNGITVVKLTDDNSGVIKGYITLNTDQSFNTNVASFGQEKIFITDGITSAPSSLNAISSDGKKLFDAGKDIPLCNQDGKNIQYTLYGFKSEAKAKESRISGNKVFFSTILHTDLKNVGTADLAVQLGDVEFTATGVTPLSKTSVISMSLEKWKIDATKWSLSSSGFILNEGKIITHMADIGFTNMEVDPAAKELKYGNYNLSKLDIKGLTTLNVTGTANFFFESGHWTLAILPKGNYCGYIPSLPGMPANQNLDIKSVFIKSDQTGIFGVDTKPFKLYNLIDYSPTNLAVYDNRIELPGTVNLNIPDVESRSALIKYNKAGSSLALSFQPFMFGFQTHGVDLHFTLDENALSSNGFFANGTLSEPGLYSVNVKLNHTTSKTEIVDIPGQTFPIDKSGNRKLTNFDGEMHVASKQWTNFGFNGDLMGANGATSKLAFIVKGDVVADGQSMKVDKIPTPFGDMSFTFDFANSRLIGHLDIEKELNGTGTIKGSAESVVDGDGWYFCAGGEITMKNNPYIKKATTAILFGDYPSANSPFITQTFSSYSYNHALPNSFKNYIKGFYIDGAAEFPVPYVPDIDVDLVVVSGHVSVSAGGSFNLGMSFTEQGTTIHTGSSMFVNASIGLGGSVGVACAGASFGANVDFTQSGELKSDGSWYLEGVNTLTLTGSAYVGGGCCDSDCDHITFCPVPCFSDDWSGVKSFQFRVHMGSDDNYVKLEW